MRNELADPERSAIKPDKPRGVPRVNDRPCPRWHLLGLAIRAPWRREGRVGQYPSAMQSHGADLLQPSSPSCLQLGRAVLSKIEHYRRERWAPFDCTGGFKFVGTGKKGAH